MEDIAALALLSWLFDLIEDRWGRAAAWLITLATGLLICTGAVLLWLRLWRS